MSPGVSVKESMEDRIKEFRSDPQKMDVTTKFVNEVVEKAKEEALKRMKEKDKGKQREEERQKIQETYLDGESEVVAVEKAEALFMYSCKNQGTGNEAGGTPEPEASSPGYSQHFAFAARRPGYRFTDAVGRMPKD